MSQFIYPYLLFLAKTITVLVALVLALGLVASLKAAKKSHRRDREDMRISCLNDEFADLREEMHGTLNDEKSHKNWLKEQKKAQKREELAVKPNLFVMDFNGDIEASATDELREHLNMILQVANPGDRVMIRLESGGGLVYAYGFAAAQLHRLRQKQIPLTVCVDKVAASGGYMMACLADEIIASPFAILGSVGVIGALPNFHRLLQKHDIDYEQHTAGKFKRSLTVLGEHTNEDREQFQRELAVTHKLFKEHISAYRPQLDVEAIATGETWYGVQALENKLIDRIGTSDDFILEHLASHRIYWLYKEEKPSALAALKKRFLGLLGRDSGPFKTKIG